MTQAKNSIRVWAFLLAIVQGASALTSGPGMPEYNDFESLENTDLVNLATGDFTYTVPVMTVPGPGLGFPIVLNYHAGIQPEQEASWVGLGWNLQAGAITRQINNVPDDFKGTLIEERIKSDHIHGWMASVNFNGVTVGLSWNSEAGLGGIVGYSFQYGVEGSPYSAGVGFKLGGGATAGAGVSMTLGKQLGPDGEAAGLSIGVSTWDGVSAGASLKGGGFSSGVGISSSGVSANVSQQAFAGLASAGVSLSSSNGISVGASTVVGFSSNTSVKGVVTNESSGGWVPLWTPWGYMSVSWGNWQVFIDGLQEDRYYGFLYSDALGMDCGSGSSAECNYKAVGEDYEGRCIGCGTATRAKKMDYNISGAFIPVHETPMKHVRLGYTGEDLYSVQTQGISGTFKPYRGEDGEYYTYLSNQDYTYQEHCQGWTGSWFGLECDRDGDVEYGPAFEASGSVIRDRHVSTSRDGIVWRFDDEVGGGLYTDPSQRNASPSLAVASRKIEPIYDAENKIIAWTLVSASGVRYVYSRPVYNYIQQTLAAGERQLDNWTRRETPAYAYAWLLTAILSPDFVAMGSTGRECIDGVNRDMCLPKQGDLGGWVLFDYSDPGIVGWRTPLGTTSIPTSYKLEDMSAESFTASMGIKGVSFLTGIETPTHRADFELATESREDAIPAELQNLGFNAEFSMGAPLASSLVCPYTHVPGKSNSLPTYPHTVSFSTASLPAGTEVTVVARRKSWRGKWSWEYGFLSATYAKFCRETTSDAVVATVELNAGMINPTTGKYEVPVASSTEIEHVRIVLGAVQDAPSSVSRLPFLRSITLKEKLTNREISSARFSYDYSLAQGTPNSSSSIAEGDGGNKGRLTLRVLQTGASSQGPWVPPYVFNYAGDDRNRRYERTKVDYWGNYCAGCTESMRVPDGNANAWNLEKIVMPSGGEVHIQYEAKTVDVVEGMPSLIDGDEIGQYFQTDASTASIQSPLHVITAGKTAFVNFIRARDNPDLIPVELTNEFQNKYVAFLGRYDIPATGESQKVNLSGLKDVGADYYVLESPRFYYEGVVTGGGCSPELFDLNFGNFIPPQLLFASNDIFGLNPNPTLNASRITSSRLQCVDPYSQYQTLKCAFDVGRRITLGQLLDFSFGRNGYLYSRAATCGLSEDNINYGANINFTRPVGIQEPLWVRVWAVFTSAPQTFARHGDGVRVSQITYREPISGRENTVDYTYEQGATPTLPSPLSNYSLGIKHGPADGKKPFLGGAGVLHGKVTTGFHTGTQDFTTEYQFITSADLPVLIQATGASGDATLDSKVKILDRSGLWGSLWRKAEINSQGKAVRVDSSLWASRINPDWKNSLLLSGINLDVIKNGNTIFAAHDPAIQVRPDGSNPVQYFGITQKLWSNRYIPKACEDMGLGTDRDNCVGNGAISTQVELARFVPLSRERYQVLDGLRTRSETNLFDFRTASPLLEIKQNRKKNGAEEYYATLASRAYHHYPAMKDSNMLTQEFSSTVFRFPSNPAAIDFTALTAADRSHVISSRFSTWNDFDPSSAVLIRKADDYALRDTSGFLLPDAGTPSGSSASKWLRQGRSLAYNAFGHVLEFENALGRPNAQIYGHSQSLPIAFAQNARSNEIFHLGFETSEYQDVQLFGVTSASPRHSRTGGRSLKVTNCMESGFTKPECSGASTSTFTCFDLPPLPTGQSYVASAWYYDQYRGSNPDNPMDPIYLNKTSEVTRPGIFFGVSGAGAGCEIASFPNGGNHQTDGSQPVDPVGNDAWNAKQRALGEKNWKRLWVDLTPAASCGSGGALQDAMLCLYAGKFMAGSDVYFDEVRVRPRKSLMTTFAYDYRGNMVSSADANEIVSHFEYDAFGNLSGVRNDDGKLLSEQAKRQADRGVNITFPDREPSESSTCVEPTFTEAGGAPIDPATFEYEVMGIVDTLTGELIPAVGSVVADKVASIEFGTGGANDKVCTQDRGGRSVIRMSTPDGTQDVPVRVKGDQLGLMMINDCGAGSVHYDGAHGPSDVSCKIASVLPLKDRVNNREGGISNRKWILRLTINRLGAGPNPGAGINCFQGSRFGDGTNPTAPHPDEPHFYQGEWATCADYPRSAMHLHFSNSASNGSLRNNFQNFMHLPSSPSNFPAIGAVVGLPDTIIAERIWPLVGDPTQYFNIIGPGGIRVTSSPTSPSLLESSPGPGGCGFLPDQDPSGYLCFVRTRLPAANVHIKKTIAVTEAEATTMGLFSGMHIRIPYIFNDGGGRNSAKFPRHPSYTSVCPSTSPECGTKILVEVY